VFGDRVVLLRHDIAQGHSGSRIAGQHFEERKRGGQDRFEIKPKKRVELRPFGCQIRFDGDHAVQRFIHNLSGDGIGRPAIEEPGHEELHERRIGIEFESLARKFIPSLMHCRWPISSSGETQYFGRKTVEQSTHPAPSKVGGRGSLGGPCVETAVLIFLAAAARAGVVAAEFHLPVSRVGSTDSRYALCTQL